MDRGGQPLPVLGLSRARAEEPGSGYLCGVGSPVPDQEALVAQARRAHREHRYDVAYEGLRRAQELAPLDPEDLHRLADAAWWLGLMTECLRLTEVAHRGFLTTGRLERAALHALDLGGMLAMRGEPALAMGWLGRARRLLEAQPVGPAHGMLLFVDLSMAIEGSQLDQAERLASDVRRLGAEHGAETLSALGEVGAGLVALHRGRIPEAYALLEEAVLRVVGGGVDPEWAGYVYCTCVSACLDVADLNRARQWSDAAYRWLEDFSSAAMFTGVCRAHEVNLLVAEGEWAAAEERAALVVRELAELNVDAVAEAEYQRAECHRMRGLLTDAEAGYARAEALGRDPQPGHALMLLARGDSGEALAEVAGSVARTAEPSRCARLLGAQVEIALAHGDALSAADAATRLREIADSFGTPGFRAWADHAEGRVAIAEGRGAEAVPTLTRAVSGLRQLRSWYDAAAAQALLARAHQALGEDALARQHRADADAVLRRLGAAPPEGPTVPAPRAGGLTDRELEVLAQVMAGRSNRETAAALLISEATVRRHLANVYQKLGVGSRTAAAAWAHEHGLVPQPRG